MILFNELLVGLSKSKHTDFLPLHCRIPRVHISSDEEGTKEIELSDDPYDCMRLDVSNVPCIVTLCKVSLRACTLRLQFF